MPHNLRVRDRDCERADDLIEFISQTPNILAFCGGKVGRGDVLRLCLQRGLLFLEAEKSRGEKDMDPPGLLPDEEAIFEARGIHHALGGVEEGLGDATDVSEATLEEGSAAPVGAVLPLDDGADLQVDEGPHDE